MTSKRSLFYSLLISLAIALVVEHRVFCDANAINDDVRNQIYWMARFLDPNYFANDYIASYFTQSSMISPIVGSIYQFLSVFADPKFATQFLPFPIIVLTTFCLFKAAELHAGSKYAFWVSYIFNLYIWTMKYTAGALPRAYFYLLFFFFLWMLAAKRWNWLIACFILEALIYPTAFFLSFLTLAIELIWTKIADAKFDPKQVQTLFLGFCAGLGVFYFRYLRHQVKEFGHMTGLVEALKMPEFYLDGRACVFVVPFSFSKSTSFMDFLHNLQTEWQRGIPWILIYLFCIVAAYWLIKKLIVRNIKMLASPRYLWTSAIASIILFFVAYMVLFYLYLPHRYIAYVLPLIPIFFLGSALYRIDISFPKKPFIVWSLALLALIIVAPHWDEDLIEVSQKDQELYQFIATLPKSVLIAAPLRLASNIPAFSYRSVLLSRETNIPFHASYYDEVKARTQALTGIYESNNLREVSKIVDKYGIDFIVIDLQQNTNKLLEHLPRAHKVFANARYVVLEVNSI